jgi:ABC-type Fe3+/spermidine/putrescine transport system ATPase subunit
MLQVREIHKAFEGLAVLRGVTFDASDGEIVALLGPSGSGKTTLLRIIAGLVLADKGQVLLDDVDLTRIPIHRRGFGMVFQDYALFPHRNVRQNVAFGLRMLAWPDRLVESRVQQVLGMVGLGALGERAVFELSGGEQQRVALARALAAKPRVLLLDEPLGSLDRALREQLMGDLRSILKNAIDPAEGIAATERGSLGQNKSATEIVTTRAEAMTSVYVTHDQEEAFAIADRIVVINDGKIEQSGTPMSLFRQPKSEFVAHFLGMDNLLPAEVVSARPTVVRCAIGRFELGDTGDVVPGERTLLIRPEAASLVSQGQEEAGVFEGTVVDNSFRGRHQIAVVLFEAEETPISLKFNFDSTVELPPASSPLHLRLDPAEMILF